MLINFEDLPKMSMENFRGGEKTTHERIYADMLNRFSKITLEPGATIGLHKHSTSSEFLMVVCGIGRVVCDGKTERLSAGLCSYCPMGSEHTIINDGEDDLILFSVTPEHTGHNITADDYESEISF